MQSPIVRVQGTKRDKDQCYSSITGVLSDATEI